ncbi:hypothetical protein [Ruegeria sp. HKCCSP335]|uniref:hypothetical protein n=1 Tax=Ruegeria sp. HKCCSP335 TaxID=2794833 RepID=UPI001AE5D1B1|nr:hypothetical protein [Ruegeria sp. HKCCSP335]
MAVVFSLFTFRFFRRPISVWFGCTNYRAVAICLAFVISGGIAQAKCADLIINDQQELDKAYRATGGRYIPLSGRYMFPKCFVTANYNAHALNNVRQTREGYFQPIFAFYDNMRDFRRDNRDPNGFNRWEVVIGVTPSAQSGRVRIVADFHVKFGKPEVKVLKQNIPGWGQVEIFYLFRAIHNNPERSKSIAFFEVSPPVNSMAARKGTKLVYGQTQDLVVASENVALPAFLLADVLRSVQLPPLSSEEYQRLLSD